MGRLFFLAIFIMITKRGIFTILEKISKKWFTKCRVMDIITVVSKKFRRRSKKMMMTLMTAINATVATGYLNNLHSTDRNGLLN
jgi:hypothetical protein